MTIHWVLRWVKFSYGLRLSVGWSLRKLSVVISAFSFCALLTACGGGGSGATSGVLQATDESMGAGGFLAVPVQEPATPVIDADSTTPPANTPTTPPKNTNNASDSGLFTQLAAQDKQAPSFNVSSPVIQAGLDVWLRPDRFGMACASCHGSPAGIELAFAGFDANSVSRRGVSHFPQQDIDQVSAMVNELARLYKLPKADPKTFRPLQPGGQPTAGATWQERDYNFLKSLASNFAPTLLGTRMETVAQAKQAYQEIAAIDKTQMPIPTVSPLWSGDGFHGRDFDTHHEWIASLPSLPKDANSMALIRSALVNYLSKPSNENFFVYYNTYREQTVLGTVSTPNQVKGNPNALTHNGFHIERAKPSSAMYAAHSILQKSLNVPALSARGAYATVQTSGPKANAKDPVFIDALSRMADSTQQRLGGPAVVPQAAIARMAPDIKVNLSQHLSFKNMDWWGLAFTYQPALNSVAAAYWLDGWVASTEKDMELFPSFRVFSMVSRGIAVNSFGFNSLLGVSNPQYFSMLHHSTVLAQTENPVLYFNADHMKLHQRMALNVYKMQFLLSINDWLGAATAGVRVNDVTRRSAKNPWLHIDLMKSFAKRNMPDEVDGIHALGIELARAAQLAYTGSNTPSVSTNGTGLMMQAFDDASFSIALGSPQIVPGVNITSANYPAADTFIKTPNPKLSPRPASVAAVPAGAIMGSSVIWSGRIVANYSDNYQFIVPVGSKQSLHDIRVTVDGQIVLAGGKFGNVGANNFSPSNNGTQSYLSLPIAFDAGQSRSIKVEHSSNGNEGQFAVLKWQGSKSTPHWLIQTSNLYPN
jgi:hypothetical protein